MKNYVVICSTSRCAMVLAKLIYEGELPDLYLSVNQARKFALAYYPLPQLMRYQIWSVSVVGDLSKPIVTVNSNEPIEID